MTIVISQYWTEPPPTPSAGLDKWLVRITHEHWKPNRRIRTLGYYAAAEFFQVYVWEYLNVLMPLLYGISPPNPNSHR